MKLKYLKSLIILSFICVFNFSDSKSKINSSIIVKVGHEIITSQDLENEIKTVLILSNENINQSNINKVKSAAIKALINNLIKKNEIKKHKIDRYNPDELEGYLLSISNKLKIERSDLKSFFIKNNLNYDSFLEKNKTELIWKTLIYTIYKNQLTINTIEVENEIKKISLNKEKKMEYELSEIEILSEGKDVDRLLKNIYKTIKEDSFEKAAKNFSISASASKGGRIGIFPEKSLSNIYLTELKKIKSGEITKPIKNSNSLVILKIDSIKFKDTKNINLDKIKKEIILKKKEEKLNLFSRSHFSNLENITLIKFQ